MIKGTIHQKDITVINRYAPNIGAPKYIKQLLTVLKREINSNTILIGNFNTPLTSKDRSSRQKVNKETVALNKTLDQLDLRDLKRTFYPNAAEYISFSSAHGTISRRDHMLGHKTSLNKLKKTEIILSIFSNHSSMKLEIY